MLLAGSGGVTQMDRPHSARLNVAALADGKVKTPP